MPETSPTDWTFTATGDAFCEAPPALNFWGGRFQEPGDLPTQPVVNPRYGRALSQVVLSGPAEVEAAVTAAQEGSRAWRGVPLRERAQVLYRLRELMRRDLAELSWLVSHENGKTFAEAQAEVLKAIECVEFGCSLPNLAAGGKLEVSRGVVCETVHEPLGVVAAVVPFNFPLMVPFWMIPQALAGGNALIVKPSERVPLALQKTATLFAEAGLPPGVFNLVNGGRAAVEALCDQPGVAALGFVGSTAVARAVYGRATAAGKRALCLGSAKNHLIVVPDADLELTADNVVASFTGCAGQRCMAASVLLAVGEVEPILNAIGERARALAVGRDVGAITSPEAVARIKRYVDQAEREGAEVLVDGRQAQGEAGGFWQGPTVLDRVAPGSAAACEEIFGPVLSVVRVDTVDEALAVENANRFGNAASVYTTSGEVARRVVQGVSAGMCGVNVGVPVPREPFGFGGWNDSLFGHGHVTGWDGFRFFTRPRQVTTKWALQRDQTWMS